MQEQRQQATVFFTSQKKCSSKTALILPARQSVSPVLVMLLFSLEEDFVFVMNVIAQAAALFPEVRIIAFEVMNNHFHFVVSADEETVLTFWGFVRKRLVRSFPLMKGLQITIKPIGDLGALRNNIVYTNRNGYVADSSHTPFSYPWGTGRYYFLDRPRGKTLARIFVDDKRRMFRCPLPARP